MQSKRATKPKRIPLLTARVEGSRKDHPRLKWPQTKPETTSLYQADCSKPARRSVTNLREQAPSTCQESGLFRPPDFCLGDYHSLRSRVRRDAAATNGSGPMPISAQT